MLRRFGVPPGAFGNESGTEQDAIRIVREEEAGVLHRLLASVESPLRHLSLEQTHHSRQDSLPPLEKLFEPRRGRRDRVVRSLQLRIEPGAKTRLAICIEGF